MKATENPGPRGARMITYKGETLSISGWARKIGVSHEFLMRRINRSGMTIEQALDTPPHTSAKGTAYGLGYLNASGYVLTSVGGSQRGDHTRIAERALGKDLPEGAVVHHVNHVRSDNRNENLVICPDENYHRLIHARERAYDACGNPEWRKCKHCKKYDSLENLKVASSGFYHLDCKREYNRSLYAARKEKRS